MSSRYGGVKPGEFLPGMVLPLGIHGLLRKRLAEIDVSETEVNCLISKARAESLVEALEVLKAVPHQDAERLYVLIEEAATAWAAEVRQP